MNTRSAAPALAHHAGATSNPALPKPRLFVRLASFGAAAAVTALVVAGQLGLAQHYADAADGLLAAARASQLAAQGPASAPARKS